LYTLVSYKPRTKRDAPWHASSLANAMAHLFWYEATASMSGAGGGANSVGYSAEPEAERIACAVLRSE